MKFEQLKLRNFRNYRDLNIQFPSGVVVFYGANGQGKTNLMEAFHLLLRGESFRPTSSSSLLLQAENEVAQASHLQATVVQSGLVHDLKLSLQSGKRQMTWNMNRVNSTSLVRQFPLVLFSPESLAAIKEGPDVRRQLLDDVVLGVSTGSAKVLKDFRRALKARNRVLRDFKDGTIKASDAARLLDSLDGSYLPLAAELTVSRLLALEALYDDFKSAASALLELPNVDISVEYVISGQVVRETVRSELLSAMHKRTQELRQAELAGGVSLVGPHKHDIRILFSGKDSRFFCSQGQQRALILSFKMAQILYHNRAYQIYPFLLLDDVLSELDPIRRTNLVGFLRDIPAQIFLTTTDLSFSMDFGDRRLNVFRIDKGNVQAQ